MMKKILITGGAGFIGSHLARLLSGQHQVRILDNLSSQVHGTTGQSFNQSGAELQRGDVTVRADLVRALDGIDTVVHLAAETGTGQSMYEIDRYYRTNVQGTALLLDILTNTKSNVSNFILASSRSVYGEGAYICRTCSPEGARRFPTARTRAELEAHNWDPPCPVCSGSIEPTATREDDGRTPASIYAATKLAQEDLVRISCDALTIPYTVLRLQNVFGEGQSLRNPYTGILSIFSTRIRLGLPLPVFEDGKETRDFIHVEDVINAIACCIDRPSVGGATLNVGCGEPISILAIASLLCEIMQSDVQPHVTGQFRIGDIRHNFAENSALEQVMGFRPSIPLRAGLERFCRWAVSQPIPDDLLDQANAELSVRNLMH